MKATRIILFVISLLLLGSRAYIAYSDHQKKIEFLKKKNGFED